MMERALISPSCAGFMRVVCVQTTLGLNRFDQTTDLNHCAARRSQMLISYLAGFFLTHTNV